MPIQTYTTGTVSVSDGSAVVTGSGGIWSGTNAKPGDTIYIDNRLPGIEVYEVTDSSHILLPVEWDGGNLTGVPYTIVQNFPSRVVGVEAAKDVSKLVAALNKEGFYWFVGPNETEPDPSRGDEGQYARQPTTGKEWVKIDGLWAYQGIFRALRPRGAWSVDANYVVGDVVSFGTTSYIAIVENNGHSPPNATYWMVSGGKGDTGEISVGTVTTGAAGSSVAITNTGTSTDAVLNFTIPRGDKGDRATVSIATTATLSPGSAATVTNSGTSTDGILTFGIPRGDQGVGIQPDATGDAADKATHDAEPKDFIFLQTDVIPFQIWVKASATSGDWSGPTFIGGELAIGDWGLVTDAATESFDFGGLI